MAVKWWESARAAVKSSLSIGNLADVFDVVSISLLVDRALTLGETVYRVNCSGPGTTSFNEISEIFVKNGGRLVMFDDSVDSSSRAALYSWHDSFGVVTFDETDAFAEFCSLNKNIYGSVKSALSGALHG